MQYDQSGQEKKEKVAAELQLHSDQGFQYASQAYFKLIQQYGITPSMSRRGNPYDNALAENFFSILKTECIYHSKIVTLAEARERIYDYIYFYFYNHQRIQTKQNWHLCSWDVSMLLRISYHYPT